MPQNFRPAIEKGIIEAASGAVAGYPLVDFKVTLIDGSFHAVDSDEHSFRAADAKRFVPRWRKLSRPCSNRSWMSRCLRPKRFLATSWAT
ncbi:MAG: hypothetical protein IPI64_15140 [Chloracidobacterium sp.]|nr:hypothetical protein [Chloracidobacterium sp.]